MKKIILMGRSECGKTTLTQALKGEHITYRKTQYVNYFDVIIDTPGEYMRWLCMPTKRMWQGFYYRLRNLTPCIRPTSPAW